MKVVTCVEDLRQMARRKVPKMFVDYAEAGAYTEQTLRANRADLQAIRFRQHVMVDVAARDTKTAILGKPVALPLALSPVGLLGMQRGNGEILAAQAAAESGIPFTLSTMSVCSIEDVAAESKAPFWFQLYVMKDRGFIKSLIERAAAAKCSALVLTVDLQVLGQRHADLKNGLSVPPQMKLGNLIDIATKPAWALSILQAKRRTFGNLVGHIKGGLVSDTASLGNWIIDQFDPSLNWKDVDWIRKIWKGKLIVKGVLDVDDAKAAVKAGADAIVVSNHGGRQLDGAPSTISVLPRIADALGGKTEILLDSGVRTGQDVMRALALGARACMIGRAYVYGLQAGGRQGVATAIALIKKELDVTMALCGVRGVKEIDRRVLAE
jgi:L-lactate dehydrogenase (cytochrome)